MFKINRYAAEFHPLTQFGGSLSATNLTHRSHYLPVKNSTQRGCLTFQAKINIFAVFSLNVDISVQISYF